MIQPFKLSIQEMEAAAIAWVCGLLGVPFVALKSITDLVDGDTATQEEFYANLHSASDALQEKLSLMLRLLADEPDLRRWEFDDIRTKSRL